LPVPTGWLTAVATGGYIYAMGGFYPNGDTSKTYRYDPVANAWDDAAMDDLPAARWGAGGDAFSDGKIILAGGVIAGNTSDSVIIWNPTTNTWGNYDPMLQPRARMSGAVVGAAYYNVGGDYPVGSFTGQALSNPHSRLHSLPQPVLSLSQTCTQPITFTKRCVTCTAMA
jgi:hypothetical protein